ncbi:hyaluronidase-1 isoform X1 [Camelus bactrianus]|uniref:Hyaluronidase-1 isoform X1 n=1 Tax=Camelus bactrianus TaxID=9837 RepID=A0A9W3FK64_CAMBA
MWAGLGPAVTLALVVVVVAWATELKPTAPPIFTGRPFVVAWDVPTQDCGPRHKVPLDPKDMKAFDVQASPNEGFVNQNITIFYHDRLGMYPHFDSMGRSVHGGVPQNGSLWVHLKMLKGHVEHYIRTQEPAGLAVIDWEDWRPVWVRNWRDKDVYRQLSRQLVASRHPDWPPDRVIKQAQYEFEFAARQFMLETLRFVKAFRPRHLWGFYLFPDCYNHDYVKNEKTYTGRCPDVEVSRNDQLAWLWAESTALFPSVYLEEKLASSTHGRNFVSFRVQEALRVAHTHHSSHALPVYVFTRPTYSHGLTGLSEMDLISTIGESAALGAAGVILWGDARYTMVSLDLPWAMAAHLLPICTLFLNLLSMAQGSRGPVVPNRPFTTVWNANTQWCLEKHGVDVDISVFDVVANPGQDFRGPNMTIFYSSQLGTYPYYTSAGEPVFGGLPQNASLDAHLVRTFQDILAAMPASDFSGLAVIDWEAWRPRWAFNWDTKEIYRQRSRSLVQRQHPYWPAPLVEAAAQDQFQGAAQAWMAGTLKLGQALRPHGLWGYYGFPDCYNYDFLNPNYTGQCPPSIRAQNDQLGWLWSQSRALYPSIYIPAAMEGTRKAQMYVRHRVSEAFRVAVGAGDPSLPVLPYVQIFYDMTNHFLPLEELEHSLGESAAQGAAGVVLWVSWENTRTKESCQAIKEYVDTTLGPFILNVTSGALLCSQALCSGHGRCVRRLSHPEALLNFNPTSFSIKPMPGGGQLTLRGALLLEDWGQMAEKFKCRCYRGWRGTWCEQQGMW